MKIVDTRKPPEPDYVSGECLTKGQVYQNARTGSMILATGRACAVYLRDPSGLCGGPLTPHEDCIWECIHVELHIV